MADGTTSRLGVLGGIAGVLLGGFTWVVIYGLHLRDHFVAVSGFLVAIALWLVAARILARYPDRRLALLGGTVLAVAAIDWLYIGLVQPRLPELPANPAIGISRSSLRAIQPALIAGSVAGTALILWDLLRSEEHTSELQ